MYRLSASHVVVYKVLSALFQVLGQDNAWTPACTLHYVAMLSTQSCPALYNTEVYSKQQVCFRFRMRAFVPASQPFGAVAVSQPFARAAWDALRHSACITPSGARAREIPDWIWGARDLFRSTSHGQAVEFCGHP